MSTIDDPTELSPSAPLPRGRASAPGRRRTSAAPDAELVSGRSFALIVAQLGALLLVIYQFEIEGDAFFRLSELTVAGFGIHYFLPLRHRLPFFVVLSFVGIGVILGVAQGGWLIGLGLVLIGICHLPLPFLLRAAVLVGLGGALALPRWGIGGVPWSDGLWPILGSMFVFRLILYMYDRKHTREPANLWQTLGYFFLLPNVCFPLFPVVDYRKFCRNYYDADRHRIYQVGVEWIWRGILQLVLYRLVYHLTIDSVAVANLHDLALYMLSTFLLYVRISGQFHVIVGMLHLFGFNLPETHHRYFLASSFTDFWRRINIYWKDFMLKVFYYPAYFTLRRMGETRALILATAFTFAVTWFLHLVQWFWIRGSVLIETNDIAFWAVFGGLVTVNALYETWRPPARALKRERTLRESAGLVFRTLGTFTVICVMWSFWTAESVSDWALMVRGAMALPPWPLTYFAAVAIGVPVALAVLVLAVSGRAAGERHGSAVRVPAVAVLATSVLLCVVSLPGVTARLAGGDIVQSVRSPSLNRRDAEQLQRGYYENLLDVGRFNRELARVYEGMPDDFVRSLDAAGLSRPTGDEQDYELIPNAEGRFVGEIVRTNRAGMRDRDYPQRRTPGTHRIALVGPSTAMASGVKQHEGFEALVEERLNAAAAERGGKRVELLNFGVAGYSPFHMLYQLDHKVLSFEPEVVLFLGHVSDMERTSRQLMKMVRRGTLPPEPYLLQLLEQTGIEPGTGANEARRRMKGHERALLLWVYRQFIGRCRDNGAVPVFVYMQAVTDLDEAWRAGDRTQVLEVAREAGFPTLDLTGAYGEHPSSELWIAENDGHPNTFGNQLVAQRLYDLLQQRGHEFGISFSSSARFPGP